MTAAEATKDAVLYALERARRRGEKEAEDGRASEALMRAVESELGKCSHDPFPGATTDKELAAYVERRWPSATGAASAVRRHVDETVLDPTRLLRILACALWEGEVRQRLAAYKHPTLTLDFAKAVPAGYFRRDRKLGKSGTITDRHGVPVAIIRGVPTVAAEFLRINASASLTAHRLFRDLAHRAARQALHDNLDDRSAPHVTIVGGLTAYAIELGIGEKKTAALRAALDLFRALSVLRENGTHYHGLLTWVEMRASAGCPARLIVTPCAALFSGGGRGKVVPVPHLLPPLVGSPDGWGAQATLQLLVLAHFREHAMALTQSGVVRIEDDDWRRMADEAGCSARRLPEIIDGWVAGVGDDPAFLLEVKPGEWTLADAYASERDVLIEGGGHDLSGQAGGRKSAAGRRHRAARAATKARNDG